MNDECCICYNNTKQKTKCMHPLCNKCSKVLLHGGSHFNCPICRQSNIFVDGRFLDVQTINGRFIKVPINRFKTYLFNSRYKQRMEEHIQYKYNNFFMIYKYTKLIKIGNTYNLISDLDTATIEYILFCEVIDLPVSRHKKYFIMDYFKDAVSELQQR